jgi:hypothetical protein
MNGTVATLPVRREERIPTISYTQSGVFGRDASEAAYRPTMVVYPRSSPPWQCVVDSLQALRSSVERLGSAT